MGTLTCLQLANSRIYRENFPPTRNFAKIMILPDAFLNPQIELDPSLHWPHPVDVFWLLKCVILTFLAWDMCLKWLKSIEKLRVGSRFCPLCSQTRSKGSVNLPLGFFRFNLDLEGILRIFQEWKTNLATYHLLSHGALVSTWLPIVHWCTPDSPWCIVIHLIAYSAVVYTWLPIVHQCTPDCQQCTGVHLIANSALVYTWLPIVHWCTPVCP